jgi:hypothetical protein
MGAGVQLWCEGSIHGSKPAKKTTKAIHHGPAHMWPNISLYGPQPSHGPDATPYLGSSGGFNAF